MVLYEMYFCPIVYSWSWYNYSTYKGQGIKITHCMYYKSFNMVLYMILFYSLPMIQNDSNYN